MQLMAAALANPGHYSESASFMVIFDEATSAVFRKTLSAAAAAIEHRMCAARAVSEIANGWFKVAANANCCSVGDEVPEFSEVGNGRVRRM